MNSGLNVQKPTNVKNLTFLCLTILLGLASHQQLFAQEASVPDGYELVLDTDFDQKNHLAGFQMTDPSAWRIGDNNGSRTLELFGASEYQPRVRSPRNIAVFNGLQVGSFVMEAEMRQTGREYGHRDMCIFFNIKDASNFYYVHIASVADPHAHNIFLVNDAPRIAIAEKTTDGVNWQQNWHRVRVERKVEDGTIKIYFDDMENPIMEATDTHFDFGSLGFGSFDDTGMVDNIRIWAPEVRTGTTVFDGK